MSAKKSALGRGFDSLIPTELLDESFDPTAAQDEQISDLRTIKLSEIQPDPDQPRRHFDEAALEEMASSIKAHGVLQPIVVTPDRTGGYMIVAGERRYRSAKLAGLDKIPALVRTLSGQHKLELSLIENLQRRDLNVLETATAYLKLRDQFNLTLDEIGQRVGGKSISTISNTLRLLRLPEPVRQALATGVITEGQARPLVNLTPEEVAEVFPLILKEEWSSRKIEQYIVDLKKSKVKPIQQGAKPVAAAAYDEQVKRIHTRLKADVSVRANSKGAGTLSIRFKNDEDFQRLVKLLED